MSDITLTSLINTDAKDFNGIVQAFFEYAQNKFPEVWSDFNSDQFMVLIAELIAYEGDLLTYYLDRQTTENFMATARLRQSVIDIAQMLDYRLSSAVPATGQVTFTLDAALFDYNTPIPAGFKVGNGELVYETTQETLVPAASTSITVDVIEGETKAETVAGDGALGQSEGTPSQEFTLDRTNVILSNNLTDLADDITVLVGNTPYTPIFNLGFAQSTDKSFTLLTNDADETKLVFGNGIFGVIPPLGVDIEATYRFLLPEREDNNFGNVNASAINTLVDTRDGITEVTNASAFTGGRDKESLEEARVNAPASVKAGDRAVSVSDHITLAKAVDGVAKAAALTNSSNVRYVDLYIAPEGGGLPSQTLKNEVVVYFEPRKMMRTKVFVRDPIFQPVAINLRVQAEANNRNEDVENAISVALLDLFDFDNLDFGQGVFLKSTGGADIFDINETLESITGIASIKYNRVTIKPSPYGKKFSNTGTPEFIGTDSKIRSNAERKEFEAELKSTTEFLLKNKIFGISTSLNDTRLEDNLKNFLLETGSSSSVAADQLVDESQFFETNQFSGQTLIDSAGSQFEIDTNTDTDINLISGSGTPAAGSYQIVQRLVGYLVNPNTEQTLTFLVTANDANSVTVDSGLSEVAVIGNTYEILKYETNKFDPQAYQGSVTLSIGSTSFRDSGATGFADDYFNDMYLIFKEGVAANIPVKVTNFVQATGEFTFPSLGAGIVPVAGDRYTVSPAYRLGLKTNVASIPAPTATQFSGDALGGEGDDFYNEYTVFFTDGTLEGQARKVTDYDDAGSDTLLVNAFGSVPAIGNEFQLVREYQTDDQSITFGLLATNPGITDIYVFQTSPLVGNLTPRENQILQLVSDDLTITVVGGS